MRAYCGKRRKLNVLLLLLLLLQGGGEVDCILGGDGGDGDERAACVGDDARELGASVGVAEFHLSEEAVELEPGLLEEAETGFSFIASLFCALRAVLELEDGLARGLWELSGLGWLALG